MRAAVLVFALCAAACAIAHIAILRSVVRSAAERPPVNPGPGVPRPGLVVELLWAVIPMLVLALVLTATWVKVRANRVPAEPVMEVAR